MSRASCVYVQDWRARKAPEKDCVYLSNDWKPKTKPFIKPSRKEPHEDCVQLEERKIILNYLPSYFTASDLHNLLKHQTVGYVGSNLVFDHTTGSSRCFGFAEYSSREAALAACTTLTGIRMTARKTLQASMSRVSCEAIKNTNLHIRAVPKSWTNAHLLQYFSRFGQIIKSQVVRDPNTGLSTETAFVRFSTNAEANAVLAFHASIPYGLKVSRTVHREDIEKKKALKIRDSTVFVQNVFGHTEESLRDYFEEAFKYKVIDCNIVNGMAHVRFENAKVANAVVASSEYHPDALPVQKLF